jgi:hypothetical protein
MQHLGLWDMQKRPPPKINSPPSAYHADEQIPSYDNADPDYPFEAYFQFKKQAYYEGCAQKQQFCTPTKTPPQHTKIAECRHADAPRFLCALHLMASQKVVSQMKTGV